MKIIIAIGNKSMGGAQRVTMALCKWLNNQKNVSSVIVSLSDTKNKKYDMSEYKTYDLKSSNKIIQLIKIIQKEKPDLFLSMGVPMSIYTVPACLYTNVKHIISERNDPQNFSGKKITKYLSRMFMKYADGYVFQTLDAQNYYKNRIKKESVVIPNPIFGIELMPDSPYKGKREKSIVSVGRLNPQKNYTLLIKSFAEILKDFPEYTLYIWGEGSEREKLEYLIKTLKIEKNVFLPGNTNDVFNKIYKASLFVLCSNFEGMPNALMEAMALGVPCISTDCPCGGPRELINNDENGILISVDDENQLVSEMKKIISSKKIQDKLGTKSFEIREKYSIDNICKKWLDYFEIIKNK